MIKRKGRNEPLDPLNCAFHPLGWEDMNVRIDDLPNIGHRSIPRSEDSFSINKTAVI
jgi:hypothetical protein